MSKRLILCASMAFACLAIFFVPAAQAQETDGRPGPGGGLPPFVTGFSPAGGQVGTPVTVTGRNLQAVQNVFFGDQVAVFQEVAGGLQLRTQVPPGAVTAPIRVVTATGSATSSRSFVVGNNPPPQGPTISAFSPASGPVGTTVQIFGSGLSGTTQVRFNNVLSSASFSIVSDSQVSATVLPIASSGPITVVTTTGIAISPGSFTVTANPLQPVISVFSPQSGSPGTQVTLFGQNLFNVQNVFFGGQVATFQELAGGNQLRTVVPSGGVTGPITVTTAAGAATSIQSFVVSGSSGGGPIISSFTPTSGPVFTQVQVYGSGFLDTFDVRINGVPLSASYSIVSDNQLSITVQPVATSGPISVLTTGGTAYSAGSFAVLSTPQQPSISGFSPGFGGLGTLVTIYGQNLAVVQNVFFNGQVAVFQEVAGGNQLRTWVPPGASTGPIRVVTAAGAATSAQSFIVP
jgi:large repetitive protein